MESARLKTKTMTVLPSRFAVLRYKLAALTWMLLLLVLPGAMVIGGYTILMMDGTYAVVALELIGLALLAFLTHRLCSLRARCPRCLTGSFSNKGCSLHGGAKRLLGSHRLHLALSVVFQNRIQCPYCGEFTAMKARSGGSSRGRR